MDRAACRADTLEIKQPEQWCAQYDGLEFGLHSNCGPLQQCIEVGSPNEGFTNFDTLAGAMLSVFQAFSEDKQSRVMWPW